MSFVQQADSCHFVAREEARVAVEVYAPVRTSYDVVVPVIILQL